MKDKFRICCIGIVFYLSILILFCLSCSKEFRDSSTSNSIQQVNKSYLNEKRASPTYDKIIGEDGLYHYRVFFWVSKKATKFMPYADNGVETNVSEHGPVGKWSVQETKITNNGEKLVFIFVPKTFVYLYGEGFENVIHLKYI